MLALKDFTVLLNEAVIVGPVSLRLPSGHLLAVTGPNGSGKSTFLRGLVGLTETQGIIEYEKTRVSRLPGEAVGYVPQRFQFPGTLPLTVREFFRLSSLAQPDQTLCHQLTIDTILDQAMSSLSGGELQRVVLARALARSPKLLVLDEASAGIDQSGKTEIAELLQHLLSDHSLTIVTVTHDSSELRHYKRILGRKFHELTLAGHSH